MAAGLREVFSMAITVPEEYQVPLHLFFRGENSHSYELFGYNKLKKDGKTSVVFRCWAPHAKSARVVGHFNH